MPIKQITPKSEIEAMIRKQVAAREKAITYKMASIGEEVVNFAKETRGYTDRTGNLVSSTGHVLVKNGKVTGGGNFVQAAPMESQPGVQYNGATKGESFAEEVAAKMPNGVGIVVVAGMGYAGNVEATGRNVLALSELKARKLVSQFINKISNK